MTTIEYHFNIMSLHLGLHVTEILRVLRELRKGWYVLQFPDRAVLIGQILPALSKPGTAILWVGCQAYTRRYPVIIERQGAECWTLEIDPAERRWGHPKRHTVGDLRNVGALYPPDYFHVALVKRRVRLGTRYSARTERGSRGTCSHPEARWYADAGLEHGPLF